MSWSAPTVAQQSDLTDSDLALALNGECHTVEVIVWLAREVKRYREAQQEVGATKRPEMPEIFPFVTVLHREVVLRPKDGKSEDIEMTPDEADRVASLLRATVGECPRGLVRGWYGTVRESADPVVPMVESVPKHVIQLSGNADIEIFPFRHCIVEFPRPMLESAGWYFGTRMVSHRT